MARTTNSTAMTARATASIIGTGRSIDPNRRWTHGARCSPSSASIWRNSAWSGKVDTGFPKGQAQTKENAIMCTSIIEIARAEGMAKRNDEWFELSTAVVAYDHARHANLGDVVTLDFINTALEPGARAGVEPTLETAKELRAALDRAIAAADFEEAEVRGKGALPSLVRAA